MTDAPATPDARTPREVSPLRWMVTYRDIEGESGWDVYATCDEARVFADAVMGTNAKIVPLYAAAGYTITPAVRDDAARVEAAARALIDASPTVNGYFETHLEVARSIARIVLAAADAVAAPGGEADARDAARYRWLSGPLAELRSIMRYSSDEGYHLMEGEELDAAIDAEIATNSEPTP